MSKGWVQRPLGVKRETFNSNWDRIFGNKEEARADAELSSTRDSEVTPASEVSDQSAT